MFYRLPFHHSTVTTTVRFLPDADAITVPASYRWNHHLRARCLQPADFVHLHSPCRRYHLGLQVMPPGPQMPFYHSHLFLTYRGGHLPTILFLYLPPMMWEVPPPPPAGWSGTDALICSLPAVHHTIEKAIRCSFRWRLPRYRASQNACHFYPAIRIRTMEGLEFCSTVIYRLPGPTCHSPACYRSTGPFYLHSVGRLPFLVGGIPSGACLVTDFLGTGLECSHHCSGTAWVGGSAGNF